MSVTSNPGTANPTLETIEIEIDRIVEEQRRNEDRISLTTLAERREKLRRFEDALLRNRQRIRDAVWADFRKPPDEADLTELFPVVSESRFVRRNLRRWMKPQRVSAPLTMLGSKGWIHHEPKGVVLIIAPWNYPLMLTFNPLVSAIAAGNCAVLKPSEQTPASSALIREITESVFPPEEVAVVEGGADTAQALLSRRWDHIFFTGGARIGRVVMEAAAKHLTPVTLELGGKSPAIVDHTANLETTARRIAWGKCINGGQTCTAPDYLLVENKIEKDLVAHSVRAMEKLFPSQPDPDRPLASIVSDGHFERISRLIEEAKEQGASVAIGGPTDPQTRRIPPTVLTNVGPDAAIMQEEIFGPVLPILTWETRHEPISIINARDKPLALYVFTRDRAWRDEVLAKTSAGGGAVNDTVNQFVHPRLPFGGVGASGIGKAHGRAGFEVFSNARSILQQPKWTSFDPVYPPYGALGRKIVDILLKWF